MNKYSIVDILEQKANNWHVNPDLVIAIATHESGLNPDAVAGEGTPDAIRGGSYGLMQMSLKTARGLGYTGTPQDLLDPERNANLGCMLLHQLCKRKGYTVRDVICAYNSGKPEAEAPESTRTKYLPAVLAILHARTGVESLGTV